MKIGKPVSKVPPDSRGRDGSKYREVYDAAYALEEGQVLPVEMDTNLEAFNLFQGARGTLQPRGFRLNKRGNVVYITRGD